MKKYSRLKEKYCVCSATVLYRTKFENELISFCERCFVFIIQAIISSVIKFFVLFLVLEIGTARE